MKKLIILVINLIICANAFSETVVRMELQNGSEAQNIDIKLYDSLAPITVTSFLKFSDAAPQISAPPSTTESFTDSFIHRIDDGVVLEGGKFSYTPASGEFVCDDCYAPGTGSFPGGLQRVTLDPLIPLEFNRSNIRGTISMRKVRFNNVTEPFSPSHWFINLGDNSELLDVYTIESQGPYPVFGEIINSTMSVVDGLSSNTNISLYDLTSIHFDFPLIPLVNYSLNDQVEEKSLVKINSVKRLFSVTTNLPVSVSSDAYFGTVLTNTNNKTIVSVLNESEYSLSIISMASTDTLESPFSMPNVENYCEGSVLDPLDSCQFAVYMNPTEVGEYFESFNIGVDFGDGVGVEKKSLEYELSISGKVVSSQEPRILASNEELVASTILVNTEQQMTITVENAGLDPLNISSIKLTGNSILDYQFSSDCVQNSPISISSGCSVIVTFSPNTTGYKAAELEIASNDPSNPILIIPMSGFGDTDTDGVSLSIENQAPNSGDNNFDGVSDSVQNSVVSILGNNNKYMTVVVDVDKSIENTHFLNGANLIDAPVNANENLGVYSFNVITQPGEIIEIGMIFSDLSKPDGYFIYSTSKNNKALHWFKYPVVNVIPDVNFTSRSGALVNRDILLLTVQDGGPGDSDGIINGRVTLGPGFAVFSESVASDSSSGGMSIQFLFFLLALQALMYFRSGNSISSV